MLSAQALVRGLQLGAARAELATPLLSIFRSGQACSFAGKAAGTPPRPKAIKTPVPSEGKQEKEKSKKEKPTLPRALSAYTFFVKEQAGSNIGGGKDLLLRCAEKWHAMGDAQKAPYLSLAEKSKEDSARMRAAAKAEAKAKAGPLMHYTAYVQEVLPSLRAANPGLESKEYLKLASGQWKQLPEAERERRKAAYHKARDAWMQSQGGGK